MAIANPAERITGNDFRGFGSALTGINKAEVQAVAQAFGEAALAAGRRRIIAIRDSRVIDLYAPRASNPNPPDERGLFEALVTLRNTIDLERGRRVGKIAIVLHHSSTEFTHDPSNTHIADINRSLGESIVWSCEG